VADHRLDPSGVKPSTSNGDVLTTASGVAAWAAPVPPIPLVTVVDGIPGLVFDNDGSIVYLEGA
jgi:hypothetical protein